MDIGRFNPWWLSGGIPRTFVGRDRRDFHMITPFIEKRQVLLLKGLRRVGKTTLLYMLMDFLIQKGDVQPYQIFYFSFDEEVERLEVVLEEYRSRIVKKDFLGAGRLYIFLDEVQKLKDWANQLKLFYDLYPNIKFIVSGSAALGLLSESKESLAGRVFDFNITPLDFKEYLIFKDVSIDYDRLDIAGDILKDHLRDYIRNSGFIEVMDETDERVLEKYFRESILERVIFRDIPEIFNVKEPSLLLRLLKIIANDPGILVEYKHLGNDLGRDQRTISQYFDYLKYSLLVRPLYYYSRNLLTSEKKAKKYYLSTTAFTYFLSENRGGKNLEGKLIENLMVSLTDAQFFYRTSTKEEVDIIKVKDSHPIPIEIKYRSSIYKRDARGLNSFMKKYSLSRGTMITRDLEGSIQLTAGTVDCVPYWKFLVQYGK